MCGGPPGFIRKVVPDGAARRVSLQRGVISRGGFKARHHDGNRVQSLGKHAVSGEVPFLFLAPARPDGTRGTEVRYSGIQAEIRTGKINNPQPPSSLCCNTTQKLRDQGPRASGSPQGGSGGKRFPQSPYRAYLPQVSLEGWGSSDPSSLKLIERNMMSMA